MFTLSQLKQSKYIRMLSRNRDIVLILKKGRNDKNNDNLHK